MAIKKKYFTTRKWGFGSNIVNFLKSSFYCGKNNYKLVLNDTHNTISDKFNLFSVVQDNSSITRSKVTEIIPVESLKSFIKYNLSSKNSFQKKLSSFAFLLRIRKEHFLNNFNSDAEVNRFFSLHIENEIGRGILKYWNYTEQTLAIFKKFDEKYNLEDFVPDISIQVRGGDKVLEIDAEGAQRAGIGEYLSKFLLYAEETKKDDIKVYIMTDTYSYYKFLQEKINEKYPNAKILTLALPHQEGYIQGNFNQLDESTKLNEFYFFLYELEFLRKAQVTIGSFNSNIFYLAHLIKYSNEHKSISVDATLDETFL